MAANKRDAIAPRVAELRQAGKTWTEIGKELGVDGTTAHIAVDPEYAAVRRARINHRRREKSEITPEMRRAGDRRVSEDDAKVALASIPADTRDLTARMLGDPLPGRSALDRRGEL